MKDEKKKIMMASIVTLLVLLSVFAVVPAAVSAKTVTQGTSVGASAPVGTVTLSPSDGAFPGQIVYFTWTGVPTDLVPPVYVTVYMNGAAYSTQVATYDAVNGVLKGTFTMPNDEPGTVFDISFSYRDSANNYATNTVNGYATVNMGIKPGANAMDDNSEDQAYRFETGNSQFQGTVEMDGWGPGSIVSDWYDGTGASYWNFNVSSVYVNTAYLYDNDRNPQDVVFHNSVDYGYEANFTNYTGANNITVNSTKVDEGPFSLSLPASDDIKTNFTFNSAGDTITSITTTFYVNTTVSGVLVALKFDGVYSAPITADGTYTLPGHFHTVEPSYLDLSGQFSASYDILKFGKTGGTFYVNYTLSITFNGQSSDGVVTLNDAQYKNENPLNDTSTTTTVDSVNTLTLFGNYQFLSRQVGLRNPGVAGDFKFNFLNSTYGYWVNGTHFLFSNYVGGTVDNGIPPLYFNQTINVLGFNETLVGTINITLVTNYYIPGVYDIAPAIWNFTVNYTFEAVSSSGIIKVSGELVNPSSWGTLPSYKIGFLAIGSNGYGNGENDITTYANATLNTHWGYPKIDYIYEDVRTLRYDYNNQEAILTLQPVSVPVNEVVVPSLLGSTNSYYANRVITGLNETLNSGPYTGWTDNRITITYNDMSAAIYGVSNSGLIDITYYIYDQANNSNQRIHLFGHTESKTEEIVVSEYVTTHNAVLNIPSLNTYRLDLGEYEWYLHDVSFTAYLNATFPGYVGYLNFSGEGRGVAHQQLYYHAHVYIDGNITGLEGFANNSMQGWFNASLYVSHVTPSLYGGVFNGSYTIYANFMEIKKNGTDYPYFDGYLKTTIHTQIPTNDPISPAYTHHSLKGTYYRHYMKIYSMMRSVNITNASLSGEVSLGWPTYGTHHHFVFSIENLTLTGGTSGIHYSHTWYNESQYGYTSGNIQVEYDGTPVDYYLVEIGYSIDVGAPIHNVSLIPVMDAKSGVRGYISSGGVYGSSVENAAEYYVEFGYGGHGSDIFYNETTVLLPTTDQSPLVIEHSLFDPSVYYWNWLPTEFVSFQSTIGNITFTTNPVGVRNVEDYYVTGVATSPTGTGTVTGVVHLNTHYPTTYYNYYTSNYYIDDHINVTAELHIHLENNDGTHTDITVTIPGVEPYIVLPRYYSMAIGNVPYTLTTLVNEGANEGSASYGSYMLEEGAGALVVNISNDSIATIVTKVGDVVNISLDKLDAKIVGLWDTANETYLLLQTVYGDMIANFSALDAKLVDIQNGIATINTILGDIQTNLTALNAKIADVQGALVTLQTNLGYVNTTLNTIEPVIMDIQNGVMDIQTVVGEINMNVTEFKNAIITKMDNGMAMVSGEIDGLNVTMQAQLSALDAKIADVQGALVTLQTNLGYVNTTLNTIEPVIMDIQNGVMDIQTVVGEINMNVTEFKNAIINEIDNGMAMVSGEIEGLNVTMQAQLSALDAKITKLQGDVATIQTTLGTVQVKLNAINATVVSNAKGISDLKGSVVEIQTTLGTIKGTVTDIKDGVATIQTNLGTVQTDVNSIKTNTANTSNSVNTTLYWEIGVLILVIITLALVAYVIVQVNKIAKKKESVEEETTEETEE